MSDTDTAEGDWYDPDETTFGDRLSGARSASGYTQAQLAENIGVKLKTIRAWEEDRAEPRANRVSILAGVLNVSLVWLLTGEGDGPADDDAMPVRDARLVREVQILQRDALRIARRLDMLERRLRERLDTPS
ncbi:helix-turn-helix domain-containing protein [uncultured Jannaschia sp.]|uniref:helix-turn-helix domain-containing protein n=1 Tax=Jannaschia halovivens TaxID=3388667 RepID=UPI0026276FE3|nr:helix-turn-helix domain-containing protein [uncultured Jannaschia sp.]